MSDTILLISRDKHLLETRALLLQGARYSTLQSSSVVGGAGLAFCCQLAIIDRTFTDEEHQDFLHRVHGERPNLVVLLLRAVLIRPDVLVAAVTDCLAAAARGPKVIEIDDPETPPCERQTPGGN